MKAYIDKNRCKECGLCVANCPRQAITISTELNEAGYRHAVVDTEKCIGCGLCYIVCPDGAFSILETEGKKHG